MERQGSAAVLDQILSVGYSSAFLVSTGLAGDTQMVPMLVVPQQRQGPVTQTGGSVASIAGRLRSSSRVREPAPDGSHADGHAADGSAPPDKNGANTGTKKRSRSPEEAAETDGTAGDRVASLTGYVAIDLKRGADI